MTDIFVSYRKIDHIKVAPIVGMLEAKGWSVWWDTRIDAGEIWDEVIERQLETARCVVVVWSLESIGSRWVRAEASEGLERGVLAPVHIDAARPPLEFRLVQSIDFLTWNGDVHSPGALALIRAVSKLLGQPPIDDCHGSTTFALMHPIAPHYFAARKVRRQGIPKGGSSPQPSRHGEAMLRMDARTGRGRN